MSNGPTLGRPENGLKECNDFVEVARCFDAHIKTIFYTDPSGKRWQVFSKRRNIGY